MYEKYSILMSVYKNDKPQYLIESIESMLNQSVEPEEFVIVQDGPLPCDLLDVVNNYCNQAPKLFTIVNSEKNIGLGAALTLGLKNCRNELVARMDADDISLPTRCESTLGEFKKNDRLDIVGTYSCDFEGVVSNKLSIRKVPIRQEEIYQRAKLRSPFNHVTVMFKKSSVLNHGGYAPLRRSQDADLFGRMMHAGAIGTNVPEVQVLVRLSSDRMHRRKSWEHTKNILGIRFNFVKLGYLGPIKFITFAVAQITMMITPVKIQKIIYARFLRERVVSDTYED